MQLFVFICAALMILAGAIGVITRSHPVHAALSRVLTLFGVAVMYVSQEAEWGFSPRGKLAELGHFVLTSFVIMLLGVDKERTCRSAVSCSARSQPGRWRVIGLIAFAAISSRDNIGTTAKSRSIR
jgi:NADH:ubiquinone oxidoreductase subunit 6 (subunit J)